MELKERVKSSLEQALLYKRQGLLTESLSHLEEGLEMIASAEKIKNKAKLIQGFQTKIDEIKKQLESLEGNASFPQISKEAQDVILQKFGITDAGEQSRLEGAQALIRFGQFDRALVEFESLLDKHEDSLEIAKNMIRCHMMRDTLDEAILMYEGWVRDNRFTKDKILDIKAFLEGILDKKGARADLTDPDELAAAMEPEAESPPPEPEPDEDPVDIEAAFEGEGGIDISSIGLTLDDGSGSPRIVELDVSFQSGKTLNVLLSSNQAGIVQNLDVGDIIRNIQFFSPVAIYKGSGIISAKLRIDSGPKQGDYSLDIKIKKV